MTGNKLLPPFPQSIDDLLSKNKQIQTIFAPNNQTCEVLVIQPGSVILGPATQITWSQSDVSEEDIKKDNAKAEGVVEDNIEKDNVKSKDEVEGNFFGIEPTEQVRSDRNQKTKLASLG